MSQNIYFDEEYYSLFFRSADSELIEFNKAAFGEWTTFNWTEISKAKHFAASDPDILFSNKKKYVYFATKSGSLVILQLGLGNLYFPNEHSFSTKIVGKPSLIPSLDPKYYYVCYRTEKNKIAVVQLDREHYNHHTVDILTLFAEVCQTVDSDCDPIITQPSSTQLVVTFRGSDKKNHTITINPTANIFNFTKQYAILPSDGTKFFVPLPPQHLMESPTRTIFSYSATKISAMTLPEASNGMPAAFASIKPNHNLMCYVNIKGQICVSFTTQYTNVSPLIKFPAQTPLATSAWVTMTSDFGGIIWFIGQDQKIYELVAKDFNAPEKATLTCMTKEVVNNDKDVLAAKGATILGLIITKWKSFSSILPAISTAIKTGPGASFSAFRPKIIADSIAHFSTLKTNRGAISFTWTKESSSGAGPTREYFTYLFRQFTSPEMGLFRTKKNGSIFLSRHIEEFYKPKLDAKNSSKAEGGMIDEILQKIPLTEKDPVCYILQFFGFMLARVLCTDTVAGLDLDPILFKYFKGSSLTWEDSATLAPSFFKTCSYLNSKTVTSDDELSFTVPIKILKHDKKVVEMFKLKEKQEDITQVNKEEYLQLYFQKKYVDPIVKYLDAVKTGFLMCFPSEFVDGLSPQELKFAVCGTQVVTLDDIKKYSKLPSSGNTNDAIMKQFWTTMGKLNSEQLKKFLYFISGNSHIPYNFSGNFNISVSTTKNRAPTASTCSYSGTFYACDTQELFDKLFFCAIEGGHWGYDQSF